MTTIITLAFLPAPISQEWIVALLANAGVQDITITGIAVQGNIITVDASRTLTADEKTAVRTAFLANLLQFTDVG